MCMHELLRSPLLLSNATGTVTALRHSMAEADGSQPAIHLSAAPFTNSAELINRQKVVAKFWLKLNFLHSLVGMLLLLLLFQQHKMMMKKRMKWKRKKCGRA